MQAGVLLLERSEIVLRVVLRPDLAVRLDVRLADMETEHVQPHRGLDLPLHPVGRLVVVVDPCNRTIDQCDVAFLELAHLLILSMKARCPFSCMNLLASYPSP